MPKTASNGPSPSTKGDERGSYSAPALEKGLEILEVLAERGGPMTTREIADAVGRSKGEIFRMIHVLVARGYLLRANDGEGLTLSNRLFALGVRTARARDLVSVAAPLVERLAEAIGQAAHLVVAHGGETVVIAASSGGADMNFSLKLGYRRPLIDAHSGLVLMAFQDPTGRQRMLAQSAALMAPPPDMRGVERHLNQVRAAGFLMAESRDIVGVTDIACPVLGSDDQAIASVTVAAVSRRGRANRFNAVLNLLRRTCREIARQI